LIKLLWLLIKSMIGIIGRCRGNQWAPVEFISARLDAPALLTYFVRLAAWYLPRRENHHLKG